MLESIRTPPEGLTPQEIIVELKELLVILRRGWRLIALCCAICLALAVVYLAGARRSYRATAKLLVLEHAGRPLNMAGNDPNRLMEGNDDYIPTHAQIISSPLVVIRAIDKIGLENLPTLLEVKEAGKDPVKKAIDRLKVTRPDRTAQVLKVDYEAGSREEAVRMLQEMTVSYKDFLDKTLQNNTKGVIELIENARSQLKDELQKKEAEYREFRKNSMVLAANETGRTFMAQRLEQADRSLNQVHEKALNLRNQLELGRKLAGQDSALWAVAHAISQLDGGSSSLIANLSSSTSQFGATDYVRHLIEEQQQLAEHYGTQNAKVKELQEQITRIQERSRSARSTLERAETADLLRAIEASLQSVEVVEKELALRFAAVQEEARAVEITLLDESNLRTDVDRQRALFNTVLDQLKQASFSQNFNSINSEIIEPVNSLKDPVWPKISIILPLALMLGGLAGVGATLVTHWMDQRIRSLPELRGLLDHPVLGQILELSEHQRLGIEEFGLISQTSPRSACAEAYRAVRTNIDFIRRSRNVQVIQVTSPHSGDGKSASASNLAISMARAGRRVVLIDCDLRKPSLDKVFGLNNERGFSMVLSALVPLDQVIRPSPVEGLDLVMAGPVPPNPAELLASPQFGVALAELRSLYDVVIIDTSPLLAVTDPAIIGSSVDGVVLVLRPSSLKRRDAESVREMLGTLGTVVLGTLINRIERTGGGGDGFGSYGYGYGYGYGTRYGVHPEEPGESPALVATNGSTATNHVPGLHDPSANGHSAAEPKDPNA